MSAVVPSEDDLVEPASDLASSSDLGLPFACSGQEVAFDLVWASSALVCVVGLPVRGASDLQGPSGVAFDLELASDLDLGEASSWGPAPEPSAACMVAPDPSDHCTSTKHKDILYVSQKIRKNMMYLNVT